MAGNFELDLDAGAQHTSSVEEIINDLRQTLKTITNEVDAAKASWVGGAFTAFQGAATEWDGEAQRLNRALDELRETLGGTVFTQSSSADEDTASTFSASGLNL
ncbi:WXG100 family type VII secretion target [Williamsia sp.]|uniref:WXG100 family type VII secretion target n=1 Tax=Williamsia sp. TaxID=1872085 RepID=UPI0025DCA510|nr:WXG100 family type VII secretion target [Williamsia sp.]